MSSKIPKIIHYVWVGKGPLTPLAQRCIASWKTYLGDYEFKLWNEENSPMDHPYIQAMYKQKKWAFVSDYIRFWALEKYGGIYLDTDTEVLKSFDDLLSHQVFFGQTKDGMAAAGVIGAVPHHPLAQDVLHVYDEDTAYSIERTSPKIIASVIDSKTYDDVVVYDYRYFNPCNDGERRTKEKLLLAYTNNHWAESWVRFRRIRKIARRIGVMRLLKKSKKKIGASAHILFVTSWSPHGTAGAERSVTTLANGFSNRYRITVAALAPSKIQRPENLCTAVQFLSYEAPNARRSIRKLAADIRRIQPDIVVSNVVHINTNTTLALWLAGRRIPHVCINRGLDEKHAIDLVHCFFSYPFCSTYVAVSDGLAQLLRRRLRWLRPRIAVVHNGLDIERILQQGAVPLSKECIVWDPNRPTVVAVGRMVSQKSFDVLLKAVAILRQKYCCSVNLLLVGDGQLREEFAELSKGLGIGDLVYFLGWQDNPQQYMRQADVFVLSSYFEGFGNVLVEALALGVPVVSTDCPSGPAEILSNGQYGRLVPVNDPEALAAGIAESLQAQTNPSELLERAREFSNEIMLKKYDILFRQTLED